MDTGSINSINTLLRDGSLDLLEPILIKVASVQLGDDHSQLVHAEALSQLCMLTCLSSAGTTHASGWCIEATFEATYKMTSQCIPTTFRPHRGDNGAILCCRSARAQRRDHRCADQNTATMHLHSTLMLAHQTAQACINSRPATHGTMAWNARPQ